MIREILLSELFMGEDATIRVEFEITHWGSPAVIDYVYGGEPAEGAEWEITEIGVTIHMDDGDGAEWLVDWRSKQFSLIANSGDVVNAILEEIAEEAECRPYRRARRYWRAA